MDLGQGIAIGLPSMGAGITAVISLYKYSNKPRMAQKMSTDDNTLFNRFMDLTEKHIEQLTVLNGSLRSIHTSTGNMDKVLKEVEVNQHNNNKAAEKQRDRIEKEVSALNRPSRPNSQ
jgi:hypothetical protein